eukprot:451237_1
MQHAFTVVNRPTIGVECRYFNTYSGCFRGQYCRFQHIQYHSDQPQLPTDTTSSSNHYHTHTNTIATNNTITESETHSMIKESPTTLQLEEKEESVTSIDDIDENSIHYLSILSNDVWEYIFTYLTPNNTALVCMTCKEFNNVIINSEHLAAIVLLQYLKVSAFPKVLSNEIIGNDMDIQFENQLVIPIFDQSCFNQTIVFSHASIFQVYARLLSYNWRLHLISNPETASDEPKCEIPEIYDDFYEIHYDCPQ